jgi:predicted dehydrogenase
MKSVRMGVIGCGYWGPNLIRNIVEAPGVEAVGVADLSPQRLAAVAARFPGVRTVGDYHELLALGADAVIVATPPATHHTIARDCLLHGVHVLVEKPLALTSAHAEELIQLAAARGLVLMAGHTFEYNAAVHELKRLLQAGELGEVGYIDAVRTNLGLYDLRLNALWDLAPHDISIILYLLGHNLASVRAWGSDTAFAGVYDNIYLNLQFATGAQANVRVSWLDPVKARRTTIVGRRRMVVYDDTEPVEKVRVYDKGVERLQQPGADGALLSYRYGDADATRLAFAEPLREEIEHYAACIRHGLVPRSDGVSGLNVVKVLEAAERSLQLGGLACRVQLAPATAQERTVGDARQAA